MARRSIVDVERRLRDTIKAVDDELGELKARIADFTIRRSALSDALKLIEETDDDAEVRS